MESKMVLPGEGDTEVIERTRVRIECENCGEPADQRHTYLVPNARRNPQSSAYGQDDCSWCSDHEVFSCKKCRDAEWRGHEPKVDGYEWCSTFSVGERFAHMFLRWSEKKLSMTTMKNEAA
jgi:hypothetical protein